MVQITSIIIILLTLVFSGLEYYFKGLNYERIIFILIFGITFERLYHLKNKIEEKDKTSFLLSDIEKQKKRLIIVGSMIINLFCGIFFYLTLNTENFFLYGFLNIPTLVTLIIYIISCIITIIILRKNYIQ
jgi:hypothetical protein